MKNSWLIKYSVLLALIAGGCSSSIVIKDAKYESPSYSMFGENPARNFYVPADLGDSLKLKWEGEINGSFSPTSITAYENNIFVPDLSGRVYAFNSENGKELGFIKYKGAIVPAPVVNNFILTFPLTEYKENNSSIYNYNFRSGQEESKYEVQGKVESEPVKTKDGIIFLTEQGKAFKYDNGNSRVWEFDSKGFIHSSAAMAGGRLIFGNDKGIIYILNSENGSLIHEEKTGTGFEGGFTISGDTAFTADNSGVIYAVNMNSGSVFWKFSTGYKINVFPAVDNNFVYIGNLRGDIYKLQRNDGKPVWKISTGGVINTTPLLFNDYLLQPDLNKKIYFISLSSGKIRKTLNYDGRVKLSPVYYKETLYLGVDNGKVMAYEKFR